MVGADVVVHQASRDLWAFPPQKNSSLLPHILSVPPALSHKGSEKGMRGHHFGGKNDVYEERH